MASKLQGYRRKGSYIRRFECILESPAYRDLKPVARCLLEEFQRIYRPTRQGALSISVVNAQQLLGVSKRTAQNAFHDLESHGFIKLTKGHLWQQRMAREWALTFEKQATGKQPTDDWQNWTPIKTTVKQNAGVETYPGLGQKHTQSGVKTYPEPKIATVSH